MILKTFYGRLSILFLLMILAFGGISLLIAFQSSKHLFDEVEQLLNREYAADIANELQPLVQGGFSQDGIKEAIHYMMVLNPMVEIYLLDGSGAILAYFTHPHDQLLHTRIDIQPVIDFINANGLVPLLGQDPRSENRNKPFSAAELRMGSDLGYVYVILRGQGYDRSLAMVSNNYYLRSGIITFLIALLATAIVGLSLFFIITRRITHLGTSVRMFEKGNYHHRIPVTGNDDIGRLEQTFNDMAQSIKSAWEAKEDAEKQRSDLIANISHDLRSPLTSIRGYLETILMKESSLSQKESQEYLHTIMKNVTSLQSLVQELFDLAKLEAKQISLHKETINLAELIQDVILKEKPQSDLKKISINYQPPQGDSSLEGDLPLLERVITNILENAILHTPEEGHIEISIATEDNKRIISLLDSGSGIAEEDLPHIFERFYRADKSRNRSLPGTGLGLSIAKEIVLLHEGTIQASKGPEKGALFTISFNV
ncbi:sensor histidine kinase [Spirochaeta cellobiosiphila]|uniref:sensor histidine kinase n=1 Tax=Spirochaeta cellobiosiphila TaxID=504483 RepID=UPI00069FCA14|nr:HAMP domain-containing sensor histidine kinase [Spirochaeta cellobiosiphila]